MSDTLFPETDKYVAKGAILSPDGRYRYLLWREWRGTHDPKHWWWSGEKDGAGKPWGEPKSVLFIMLNPSTADADVDDPTIRRCVAFAKRWNYERLEVLNLFAYRTKNPCELLKLTHNDDPVGHENQRWFDRCAFDHGRCGLIICAWGAHGNHINQDETALGWIEDAPRYALGVTKDGHPKHPLYLPADAKPVRFRP